MKKRQEGERKRDRIKLVDRTRTTPVVVEDQILSADPFLFLLLKISPRFFLCVSQRSPASDIDFGFRGLCMQLN